MQMKLLFWRLGNPKRIIMLILKFHFVNSKLVVRRERVQPGVAVRVSNVGTSEVEGSRLALAT